MLAAGLSAYNCRSVIVTKRESALAKHAAQEKIECFELPFRFEADISSARSLKEMADAEPEPVILHAHTPHALGLAVLSRKMGSRHPIVFTRRVSFPLKKFWLNRWKIVQADRIIAVSQAVYDVLVKSGIKPEKIRVIHSGVDIRKFIYQGPSIREPFQFVTGSAIEKSKGLDRALEFLRRSTTLPAVFHFAGEGSALSKFRAQASSLPNVRVHGFVSDIPRLMKDMFAAISFSPNEGFPNFLLQAMATGLPVVAFEIPSTRELISSNEMGFLFNSVDLARDQVTHLMKNPAEAFRIGKAASDHVRPRYSTDQMVDKTFRLYKEILS
jgi:glycosyltransferase involved in cell wall biosynthesis